MRQKSGQTTLLGSGPGRTLAGVYIIDPVHSTFGFSVRQALVSHVHGKFESFEGFLEFDAARPSRSGALVSVRTDSLDTGMRERDAYLTGPAIFDSSAFPLMTFRSTGLAPVDDDAFRMSGNLKIKDVELPLAMDVEFGGVTRDSRGRHRVGFEGTATVQRSDWGLTWAGGPGTGGVPVSDLVKLTLGISAVRVGQGAAQ
ncbi:YceI family protein [Streptomyces sp. NPDC047706]|uniref:YceI family protein n=1 Tax=Streptomyces sp. NPDC047706 TaxID=3365486 RepID=UPI003713BBF5